METTWKTLEKSTPYFIKCSQIAEDLFHINITDYKQCWASNVYRKSLLNYLKESNDGLEFDDNNELVKRGIDMLGNPETLKKVNILLQSDGTLKISISKQYEVVLRLELSLPTSSSEHFFQVVVQPLLSTICDLRSSEHELRRALLKKDKEIEEYKIEGRAPRRLITTVYNDEKHMEKHIVFEKNFGSKDEDVTAILNSVAQKTIIKNTSNSIPTGPAVQPTAEPSIESPVKSIKTEQVEQNIMQPPDIKDNTSTIIPQSVETIKIETQSKGENIKEESSHLPSPRKRQRKKLNL